MMTDDPFYIAIQPMIERHKKWLKEWTNMTASAQTLYVCDRCNAREYASTQNAVTIVPKGWMSMMTGDDKQQLSPTGIIRHLCPACCSGFASFMSTPQ